MGSDLGRFRPVYLKLQEDLERLSRALAPSYLDMYQQIEQMLKPIRQQHMETIKTIAFSGLASSQLTQIAQANQRWQELFDQATVSANVFADFERTQTWLDNIVLGRDAIAQLQAVAKLNLGDVAYRAVVAERLYAGIDFAAIRQAVALPESAFLKLDDVIGDATLSYQKLAGSMRTLLDVMHLPSFALPGATREVFTTGYVLDTLCTRSELYRERDTSRVDLIAEAEQDTSDCLGLLQSIDPALAKPYIGAHDALRGGNTDRARHILSSLRELWNHLLHRLAPDEDVLAWAPSDGKDLLDKGKPTRRARVLYICRNLNHEPLSEFVVEDTSALVALVVFLNRLHKLDPGLSDAELRAIVLRTDSWLMYILQIARGTGPEVIT